MKSSLVFASCLALAMAIPFLPVHRNGITESTWGELKEESGNQCPGGICYASDRNPEKDPDDGPDSNSGPGSDDHGYDDKKAPIPVADTLSSISKPIDIAPLTVRSTALPSGAFPTPLPGVPSNSPATPAPALASRIATFSAGYYYNTSSSLAPDLPIPSAIEDTPDLPVPTATNDTPKIPLPSATDDTPKVPLPTAADDLPIPSTFASPTGSPDVEIPSQALDTSSSTTSLAVGNSNVPLASYSFVTELVAPAPTAGLVAPEKDIPSATVSFSEVAPAYAQTASLFLADPSPVAAAHVPTSSAGSPPATAPSSTAPAPLPSTVVEDGYTCPTYGICGYTGSPPITMAQGISCAECSQTCGQVGECKFATYTSSTRECYLFYTSFDPTQVQDCPNLGLGPRVIIPKPQ